MPRATNDGVTIYYERDEGDEAVVFVQGLGYGRWMWRWQREAVAGEYGVIAPDNRGTGRSDAPGIPGIVTKLPRKLRTPLIFKLFGYSIESMAADLDAVLADAGVYRAHVVGASMGGMIAQQYAIDYDRAESLVLCCTSHGGPDALPIPDETQERIFDVPQGANEREKLRHRMRPAFNERFVNRNPHLMDRIIEWRLEQDASEPAREAQAAGVSNFDASDRLSRIRVPTLVLHGTNDRVVPVENGRLLDEKLPDGRLVEIDGGSHLFTIEDATRVNEELLAFLENRE